MMVFVLFLGESKGGQDDGFCFVFAMEGMRHATWTTMAKLAPAARSEPGCRIHVFQAHTGKNDEVTNQTHDSLLCSYMILTVLADMLIINQPPLG